MLAAYKTAIQVDGSHFQLVCWLIFVIIYMTTNLLECSTLSLEHSLKHTCFNDR